MAQFDLYRLANGQLVVDLQTDLIGIDATRIVAPLRDPAHYTAFAELTPVVAVEGADWIVRIQELVALPDADLQTPVGSLAEHHQALRHALNILIDGL